MGLTIPARVPGVGPAAGVGCWALLSQPAFPGSGEGRVGASWPPCQPCFGPVPLLGEVVTLAATLALALPLPDSPCLTQGGFSTGLGEGKTLNRLFPNEV